MFSLINLSVKRHVAATMDSAVLGNPPPCSSLLKWGALVWGPCSLLCHRPPHRLPAPTAGALALLKGLGREGLLNTPWMLRLQAGR